MLSESWILTLELSQQDMNLKSTISKVSSEAALASHWNHSQVWYIQLHLKVRMEMNGDWQIIYFQCLCHGQEYLLLKQVAQSPVQPDTCQKHRSGDQLNTKDFSQRPHPPLTAPYQAQLHDLLQWFSQRTGWLFCSATRGLVPAVPTPCGQYAGDTG